ncbi:MAG TPA: branched-chain amino acid ABC transporter permease [Burkholderiales bacterium]|nr:branched-chain amino acid ABC transporter permease [Burkholderiales bacterium]
MSHFLAIFIDGVIYSSWLFIIAVGLTLIYGVMKILNVAHGSLYALGAYAATALGGYWLATGHAPMGSYAMLVLAAIVVGLIAGPVIERGLLRFVYGKEEVVLVLVTYAVFLILEDLTKLAFGVDPLSIPEPYALLGSFEVGDLVYPTYSVVLVGLSLLVALVLALVLNKTRQGKILQAVIHDREMSAAMGINVSRVYLVTFTVGVMLAALGGALTAPTISVQPGIAAEVIVLAFAVVVIGGLGSLGGAALGAVIVGMVRAWAVHKLPEVELFSVYAVMALVLIVRPKGLFAAPEARKI